MRAQPRQIEKGVGATLALLLAFPGLCHQGGGVGRVCPGLRGGVQGGGFPGDGQVQVDSVEQRARELVAIALDLLRGTATAAAGFAQVAAGAGVHRRHQLEARRKMHPIPGAGDHDLARFEW